MLIAEEMRCCNMDFAALSKTRLLGKSSLKEEGGAYTFFWRGYPLVANFSMV